MSNQEHYQYDPLEGKISASEHLSHLIRRVFISNQNFIRIFWQLSTLVLKEDKEITSEKMRSEFEAAINQIALELEPLGLDAAELVPIWTEHKPISTNLDPESERFLLKGLVALFVVIVIYTATNTGKSPDFIATEFVKNILSVYLLSILVALIKDQLTTQAKVEKNLATIARLAKINPNWPLYFHQKYGIRLFDRYTIPYFLHTVELEKKLSQPLETEEKTGSTVLVIGGLVDTNNGFNWHTNELPIRKEAAIQNDLWSHGYNYVNLEIESLEELLKLIQRLEKKLLDSVKYFVVKAHGEPDYITLSRSTSIDNDQTRKVNLGDEKTAELLRQIFSYLPASAEILLGSCYSATSHQSGLNIAGWISKITERKTTGLTGKGIVRLKTATDGQGNNQVRMQVLRTRTKTYDPSEPQND